nr:hypothetical protein [Tanacetum cinerariifolium]
MNLFFPMNQNTDDDEERRPTVFEIDKETDVYFYEQAYAYHEQLVQEENRPRLTRNLIYRDREGAEKYSVFVCIVNYVLQESTIPLSDIISQLSPSIVITTSPPVLPIEDPEVSLIRGNEELNTIPEKESDEFIKFSVEELVPIPSESEDTSGSDSEYVLPSCDDFSPINDIECKDSYDSNLDESTFPVTPLFDSNEDEYFATGDDIELLLHRDPSTPMMSVVSILDGLIDEPHLEENDDLFDLESKKNEWKKILYDAPIDDLMTEDKIFDPEILEKNLSPTYVSLPFMDRHYLFFTYVVLILLIYFTYEVNSPFLLSSGSEDTIFDPGISAFHFHHRSRTSISFNVYLNILNESPMEICSSAHFNPNIKMIWGESS